MLTMGKIAGRVQQLPVLGGWLRAAGGKEIVPLNDSCGEQAGFGTFGSVGAARCRRLRSPDFLDEGLSFETMAT